MRTIALIDMDCFYAQVEQRDKPELWGKPVAVVQYAREGAYGGIIALSYEAKAAGVRRGMFLPEAKVQCPQLEVAYVPQGEHIDKADLQKYRDASAEVFNLLNNIDPRIVVERASVDEAFLDMTSFAQEVYDEIEDKDEYIDNLINEVEIALPDTHLADDRDINHEKSDEFIYERDVNIMEWLNDVCRNDPVQYRLAIATVTVERVRADVRRQTQFFCSAGIGNNKLLAKLVCARHKPRQQTVIPFTSVAHVFHYTPIESVRMLGGKLGNGLRNAFGITTMRELSHVSYDRLCALLPGSAKWLWHLAKGIDDEPVKARNAVTSIAAGKNFPGKNAIVTVSEMRRWIDGLAKELAKRLVADQVKTPRTAENLVVTVQNPTVVTKTLKLNSYNPQIIFNMAWTFLKPLNKAPPTSNDLWEPPILLISFSASKFVDGILGESKSILQWVAESVKPVEFNTPSTSKGCAAILDENDMPKVDEDGWQLFDPSKLDDTPAPPPEMLEMGSLTVSRDVFDELPDFIQAELEHEQQLAAARKVLEAERQAAAAKAALNTSSAKPSTSSKGKKRSAKAPPAKKEPPPKKTLDSFFKKK